MTAKPFRSRSSATVWLMVFKTDCDLNSCSPRCLRPGSGPTNCSSDLSGLSKVVLTVLRISANVTSISERQRERERKRERDTERASDEHRRVKDDGITDTGHLTSQQISHITGAEAEKHDPVP